MKKKNNFQKTLKHKTVSHLMNKGNKITCINMLSKSLKLLQKSESKPILEIVKLAILNTTPVFRLIELKEKRKKKKKKWF